MLTIKFESTLNIEEEDILQLKDKVNDSISDINTIRLSPISKIKDAGTSNYAFEVLIGEKNENDYNITIFKEFASIK